MLFDLKSLLDESKNQDAKNKSILQTLTNIVTIQFNNLNFI